jgi:hypothetical protein
LFINISSIRGRRKQRDLAYILRKRKPLPAMPL